MSQRLREGSGQQSQLPQRTPGMWGLGLVYCLGRWHRVGRMLCQSPEPKTVFAEEARTAAGHLAKKFS